MQARPRRSTSSASLSRHWRRCGSVIEQWATILREPADLAILLKRRKSLLERRSQPAWRQDTIPADRSENGGG